MSDENGPSTTLVTRVYTCHTDGCGNAGHGISLETPDDVEAAACGVCGQPIMDIA